MIRFINNNILTTATIAHWLRDDMEASKRIDYLNQEEYLKLLQQPNRYGWLAFEGDTPVGFVDMEVVDGIGYIAFYVAPESRGKGTSKLILDKLEHMTLDLKLKRLEACVESDNVASIKTLTSQGFANKGKDKDGSEIYIKNVRNTNQHYGK